MGRGVVSGLLLAFLLHPCLAEAFGMPGRSVVSGLPVSPPDSGMKRQAFGGHAQETAPNQPAETGPAKKTSTQKKSTRKRPTKGETPEASARAPASKKAKNRSIGPFTVTGSFDLQTIYDDNIFRYSDVNILRFRMADYKTGEYEMDTYDDFILSPRLNFNLGFHLVGSRDASLRLGYTLWQYASNPGKSNESWTARLRQPVFGKDYLEFAYTYAPMAFIRPLGDRAPFEPFSTTPYTYYPFRSSRNAFSMVLQKRITALLSARLEGGRVLRFYNQRFLENDNWEWNAAGSGTYSLSKSLKIGGKYTYSHVVARAADTVGETRANSNDGDPSYDRDLFQVSVDLSPKWPRILDALGLDWQYMAYYYTSKQVVWVDPLHVGRKDEVYVIGGTLNSKPLWGPMALEVGYRFTRRASSSSSAASGSLEEDKNYRNNRYWLGTSYPF